MHPPGYQSGRNTPQSQYGMAYQPAPSRPVTNYLDVAIPLTQAPEGFDSEPSDAALQRAVQAILHTADLNAVTKREVRRQLEEQFGMDLTSRKKVINDAIDDVLVRRA